jgi:[acyl-carrier-protein] S-malonyltransferase
MNTTFLFPGQGSQKIGMGNDFYQSFDIAKKRFEEANTLLGRDLATICFSGPEEALVATQNTQPAIFTLEAIICDVLTEKGFIPSNVAGHSLGEYSALYAAGFITFSEGISLVVRRGELMAKACAERPGTMAAITGMPKERIRELCAAGTIGVVVCANENSPDQTVISGELNAVKDACERLKANGAKRAILLPVAGAFHSPLMQSAADEFAAFIESYALKPPRCPVISNVTAQLETSPEKVKSLLVRQLISPVRWVDSMNVLSGLEFGTLLEVGPGSVLRNLAKKCNDRLNVLPCDTVTNVFSLTPSSAG